MLNRHNNNSISNSATVAYIKSHRSPSQSSSQRIFSLGSFARNRPTRVTTAESYLDFSTYKKSLQHNFYSPRSWERSSSVLQMIFLFSISPGNLQYRPAQIGETIVDITVKQFIAQAISCSFWNVMFHNQVFQLFYFLFLPNVFSFLCACVFSAVLNVYGLTRPLRSGGVTRQHWANKWRAV